ncbi:hypothetical protein LTS01_023514 [Friedmanniomyces endolithicus]|nr:hypothetical protein LTS01_023514 [Friedmanniomyces endolithicus]
MAESCKAWPRGQCTWGTRCKRVHHKNLDPAQYENREHQEYSVPNDVNVACPRCLAKMLPCDKKGRGGIDDPCSECRWFGGEDCNCVLSVGSSYNDVIWSVMETRERSGYDLPAVKGREAPYGKLGAKIPMPISQARLRPDWKGESREELLGKPDMLPDYVRTLPRAYLVPPGRTSKEARGDACLVYADGSWNRPECGEESASQAGSRSAPRFRAHTLIEWATGAVMHTYNDGATTTFPGPSGVSAGHSAVPMGAAKQSHTIASQPTPATKPRSPFTTAHASDSGQAGKKQKRGEQTVSNASVSPPPVTPSMSLDTAPTSGWVSMSVEDAPGATDIESDSDWEWARDDNFDD